MFLDNRKAPHGTVHAELYESKVLGVLRPLLANTPPGYDGDTKAVYPVLFLYHGYGDTVYSWIREGRVQQILDNAIADQRAVVKQIYREAVSIEKMLLAAVQIALAALCRDFLNPQCVATQEKFR
jgi:hypothetical protein